MAKKPTKTYSSLGLDHTAFDNPSLLQSDAMRRIEEEQQQSSAAKPATEPVQPQAPEPKVPESTSAAQDTVGEGEAEGKSAAVPSKDKKGATDVRNIFSRDNLHEKDFVSAVLHNDVLEALHELARVKDESGKRYPVKYLASNIIRIFLQEHRNELESIKRQFKKRRS